MNYPVCDGIGAPRSRNCSRKINKVDREVGELRASIEWNNQQLMRIDAKLDRVIERHNP